MEIKELLEIVAISLKDQDIVIGPDTISRLCGPINQIRHIRDRKERRRTDEGRNSVRDALARERRARKEAQSLFQSKGNVLSPEGRDSLQRKVFYRNERHLRSIIGGNADSRFEDDQLMICMRLLYKNPDVYHWHSKKVLNKEWALNVLSQILQTVLGIGWRDGEEALRARFKRFNKDLKKRGERASFTIDHMPKQAGWEIIGWEPLEGTYKKLEIWNIDPRTGKRVWIPDNSVALTFQVNGQTVHIERDFTG